MPLKLKAAIERHASYRRVAREADLPVTTLYEIAQGEREETVQQGRAIGEALRRLGAPHESVFQEDWRAYLAGRSQREAEMLSEEAIKFFHLQRDPWVNELEEEADLYLDAERKAVRARLLLAVQRQHFVAILGPVGAGKTILLDNLRYWMLRQERYDVVELANVERGILSVGDLIVAIIETLSTEPPRQSRESRHRQARRILLDSRLRDRYPVILIDQAQELPHQTLRALKVLYDQRDPRLGYRRLVSIVLGGQGEPGAIEEKARDLGAKLRSPSLEEVTARIYVLRLPPLTEKAIDDYIRWKLHRAGGDGLVDPGTARQLSKFRISTPGKLAQVMPMAMFWAHKAGDHQICPEHIAKALYGDEEENRRVLAGERAR